MNILEIQAGDPLLECVCNVIHAAHEAEYRRSGLKINTSSITSEVLERQLDEHHGICVAAVEDHNIVGTLSMMDECSDHWYLKGLEAGIIKYVAVVPETQQKGVASALLGHAKGQFSSGHPRGVLTVSTDERNKSALHLYRKNGFIPIDVTRGRKAQSCAVRLAYWPQGNPHSHVRIRLWLMRRRALCAVKSMIGY